jgi:hypothetical protein
MRRRAGCSMTLGERVPVTCKTDGPKEGAVVPSIAGEASVKSGGTPLLLWASVWRRSETCSIRRERVLVGIASSLEVKRKSAAAIASSV